MATTQTATTTQDRTRTSRAAWKERSAGVLAGAGSATAVWLVADTGLGIDLLAGPPNATFTVGIGSVIGASVVAGLAGWLVLSLLERFSSRAPMVWTVVAGTVLVLSCFGPLGQVASGAAAAALVAMHLAVGAVIIPVFARSATDGRDRRTRRLKSQ